MNLEIQPALESDYDIVANLARFYMYDMAEHAGWDFPDDGQFDIGDHIANYWGRRRKDGKPDWSTAWRGFPFLIRINGHPAGFALIQCHSEVPPVFDMGEFFIGRQYRGNGVGQLVATALFNRFAGQWQVREMLTNKPAQAFWNKIIAEHTEGAFSEAVETFEIYGGKEFVTQRFESKGR